MANPSVLSSLIADLLSIGIGANHGLEKYAGYHWELSVAGLHYRFMINEDGSFSAAPPSSDHQPCEAKIALNASDVVLLIQDPHHRGVQLSGRADFLETLGNALQNIDRNTLFARFVQQKRANNINTYDLTPQRVAERLALQGVKVALAYTAKLWAMLARQLIEFARDEGGLWVHQTRAAVHNDALMELSHKIERVAAIAAHWRAK